MSKSKTRNIEDFFKKEESLEEMLDNVKFFDCISCGQEQFTGFHDNCNKYCCECCPHKTCVDVVDKQYKEYLASKKRGRKKKVLG